jgi:hypothetical protein
MRRPTGKIEQFILSKILAPQTGACKIAANGLELHSSTLYHDGIPDKMVNPFF